MAAGADGGHSPIAQFELKTLVPLKIFGVDASFTNSSLFMLLAAGLTLAFIMSAMSAGRWCRRACSRSPKCSTNLSQVQSGKTSAKPA